MNRLRPVLCALTGGPCAGKTTSLVKLKASLIEAGYNCFTIPEVFTVLMNNGCDVVYPPNYVDSCNRERSVDCLSRELQLQLSLEDSFLGYAALSDKPVVIIGDRGALDLVAYAGEEMFDAILDKLELSKETLLNRYDIVLHLVTAANGAESSYSNETNEVRKETAQEARDLDKKTLDGWKDHRNLHVFENKSGGFDAKLQAVKNSVFTFLHSIHGDIRVRS